MVVNAGGRGHLSQMALDTLHDTRLVTLLDANMNDSDTALYDASFKMFLKHGDDPAAFVVKFDEVVEWIGFTRKDPAKRLLESNFKINVDYVAVLLHPKVEQNRNVKSSNILLLPKEEQNSTQDPRGGHNKQSIFLNVDAFKEFCIMANTPKAKQVRMYYLKLEKVVMQFNKLCLDEKNESERVLKMRLDIKVEREQKIMEQNRLLITENTNLARMKGVRDRHRYEMGEYVYLITASPK